MRVPALMSGSRVDSTTPKLQTNEINLIFVIRLHRGHRFTVWPRLLYGTPLKGTGRVLISLQLSIYSKPYN